MKTLLFLLAILVPVLGFVDLAQANGSIHHNNIAIGGGSDAYNEGNNADVEMGLTQDIDLTENSLVNVSPALSANGVDCNMESSSYSILLWSKGKSKCEKGSIAWRNFYKAMEVGLGPEAAIGMLCAYKEFRKVSHHVQLGGEVVNCKALRRKPQVRAAIDAFEAH